MFGRQIATGCLYCEPSRLSVLVLSRSGSLVLRRFASGWRRVTLLGSRDFLRDRATGLHVAPDLWRRKVESFVPAAAPCAAVGYLCTSERRVPFSLDSECMGNQKDECLGRKAYGMGTAGIAAGGVLE